MRKLSENFYEYEFKCRCCKKLKVNYRLVVLLQKLRMAVGKPMHITSGYRCRKHNKAVDGHPRSYHKKGMAADFVITGMSVREMYQAILFKVPELLKGGLGLYHKRGFIHVDLGPQKRWDDA